MTAGKPVMGTDRPAAPNVGAAIHKRGIMKNSSVRVIIYGPDRFTPVGEVAPF